MSQKTPTSLPPVDMEDVNQYLKSPDEPAPSLDSPPMKQLTPPPATDLPLGSPEVDFADLGLQIPALIPKSPLDYVEPEWLPQYNRQLKYLISNGMIPKAWRALSQCGTGIPVPEELPVGVVDQLVEVTSSKVLEDKHTQIAVMAMLKRRLHHGKELPDPMRWASVVVLLAFVDSIRGTILEWATRDAYEDFAA